MLSIWVSFLSSVDLKLWILWFIKLYYYYFAEHTRTKLKTWSIHIGQFTFDKVINENVSHKHALCANTKGANSKCVIFATAISGTYLISIADSSFETRARRKTSSPFIGKDHAHAFTQQRGRVHSATIRSGQGRPAVFAIHNWTDCVPRAWWRHTLLKLIAGTTLPDMWHVSELKTKETERGRGRGRAKAVSTIKTIHQFHEFYHK